ncbi:MAG: dTDP-4-dehydrorhamnose 3,5-epimerase [Desulfobacterales bacterium]|nr:dTDP-4-dehydrorhamnose 3,5-epimerase [Desulfobacterales bacterium]
MKYTRLTIPDMILLTPNVFEDPRGFFMETFRDEDFRTHVADIGFVQDNHSCSVKGTLRGLHYQLGRPQGKLVRVTQGQVFDVGVDLRKSSPYFGKWAGQILSSQNRKMLWVPPGFAHGFYVLSDKAEFCYKCTDYYAPELERCVLWNDPQIKVDWPQLINTDLILSDKDKNGDLLADAEVFS